MESLCQNLGDHQDREEAEKEGCAGGIGWVIYPNLLRGARACDSPSSAMNLNQNGADLCQKIRYSAIVIGLPGAGHSEQDAVLR